MNIITKKVENIEGAVAERAKVMTEIFREAA